MNINSDTVLVIQSLQCVLVRWKWSYWTFLLQCHSFSSKRSELFDDLQYIDSPLLSLKVKEKFTLLLYGLPNNINNLNKDIISKVIKLIKKMGCLGRLLLLWPLPSTNFWLTSLLNFSFLIVSLRLATFIAINVYCKGEAWSRWHEIWVLVLFTAFFSFNWS